MAIYRLDCSLARASVFIGRRNSPKHPRQEDQARSIGDHQPEKKCLVSIHAHLTDYALIPQYDDRMARLRRWSTIPPPNCPCRAASRLVPDSAAAGKRLAAWCPLQLFSEANERLPVRKSDSARTAKYPRYPARANLRGTLPRTRERSLKGGSFAASYSRRSGERQNKHRIPGWTAASYPAMLSKSIQAAWAP